MPETTRRFQSVARRWRGTFDAEPDTSTGENLNRGAPRGDGGSGAQSPETHPVAACGLVGGKTGCKRLGVEWPGEVEPLAHGAAELFQLPDSFEPLDALGNASCA